MRNFLIETDFASDELAAIFQLAGKFKSRRGQFTLRPLEGESWGLLFHKNSTRTRVSFQVALHELGAQAVWLDPGSMQLGRGESIEDTAKVLSRYLHGMIIRTFEQSLIEHFAEAGSIPVVNALTDLLHPCQVYSDLFTIAEQKRCLADLSRLREVKVVFLGDTSCNMANSWLMAEKLFGLKVVLCGPESFRPRAASVDLLKRVFGGGAIDFQTDPMEAVQGADFVYTDVWVSMGAEASEEERLEQMRPYSVTMELLRKAGPDAKFLHCMPTHPGWEVAQEVLDSPRSLLYDQAENRLHMQKAILAALKGAHLSGD